MIVMQVRSVQRSVPCRSACAKSEVATRTGRFSMLGMVFNRLAERSLLSALIGSSPERSPPRVLTPRVARCPPAPGSPRTCSWRLEIPGELGFPHEGLCGRRKLLTNSEIPRARRFGQRKRGRVRKAQNGIERSCDKTWAILTPRNAHLAMKNAGASIRIGCLGRRDAR